MKALIEQLALALLPRVTRPARPEEVRPLPARPHPRPAHPVAYFGKSTSAQPVATPPPTQPPLALPNPGHWKSTCMAVSYASGHQCRLLKGHEGEHRNERGSFTRALQPGERPQRRAALDEVSTRRPGAT